MYYANSDAQLGVFASQTKFYIANMDRAFKLNPGTSYVPNPAPPYDIAIIYSSDAAISCQIMSTQAPTINTLTIPTQLTSTGSVT